MENYQIDDEQLPVLFRGQLINREYIAQRVMQSLSSLFGDDTLFNEEWNRIKCYARTPEQKEIIKKYFKPRQHYPIDED